MTVTVPRVLTVAATGLLVLGTLAGCSSDSDSSQKSEGSKQVEGGKITTQDGDDAIGLAQTELPASFPKDDVPLPESGELKAVVAGRRDGNGYYSLTYSLAGEDVTSAAKDYRSALEDAGYRIESSSSVGGSNATFSAFTAIGEDWYVIVYAGGAGGSDAAMSLQVTKQPDASKAGGAPTG